MTSSTSPARPSITRRNGKEPERWARRRSETDAGFSRAREEGGRERSRLLRQIVVAHMDLADAIARRYIGRPQDSEDIRQVAYIGLVKASERFDHEKGDNFVSFAVPTISGEIKRHLRDNGWVIRPPRPVQELRARVNASIAALTQQLGRAPTTREIAGHVGKDVGDVEEALLAHQSLRPSSLDMPVGDDGMCLGDTLGDTDEGLARAELVATLTPALARLSTREQRIVYLRFFEEQTQQEIAKELGVTQMQVSRLLAKILQTLRWTLAEATPDRAARAPVELPTAEEWTQSA